MYPIKVSPKHREHHCFLPYPDRASGGEQLLVFGLSFTFYGKSKQAVQTIKERVAPLFERVTQLGGKPYYHGYHPKVDQQTLLHIYPHFSQFMQLKQKLDPENLLNADWMLPS